MQKFDPAASPLSRLREAAPEAFVEGKLDIDMLRELAGEAVEDREERYGLNWHGKRRARQLALTPSTGTLRPCPGESVAWGSTPNVFIEGDNLEVLKLLQKSYAGRVKMIYIDPPYNTGNDFIYVDDYAEPVESYLRRTGQMGESGELLTTNPRTGGRFHSNWLNMMYPRLLLARGLLRDDGVILISIDDNEVNNLRLLMAEVFGEENFIATIIWQKMDSPSRNDEERPVSNYHDYIITFQKTKGVGALYQKLKPEILDAYNVTLPDGRSARLRQLRKNGKGARREDRPTMWYPLTSPDESEVYPIAPEGWEGRWVLAKETWLDRERQGLTRWIHRDYGWIPYYIEVAPQAPTIPWPTIWTDVDQNRQAKAKFTVLMGPGLDFDNPKPVNLIENMLRMTTNLDDCLCMDFFAGSCSTADAVMSLNHEDGGSRRFVMVQLPWPTGRTDFSTIADIGKERIRRVIAKMQRESAPQLDLTYRDTPEDLGFRAYRLTRSHFRRWRDYEGDAIADVKSLFNQFESPLVEGWTPEDLLVEVMLQEGFPLDSTVTPWDGAGGNQARGANHVQIVASDACMHRLWVCLDTRVADETVVGLALAAEDVFVCLDSAVTDEQKMRLADRFNVKVI